MIRTISVALAIMFAALPAFAQTDAEHIRARVKVGQSVSIVDDTGQEFNGTAPSFRSAGDSGLGVRRPGSPRK